jgi:tetratricopeptide (TPR) repeat protein
MKYLLALTALLMGIFHPVGTLAQSIDLGGTSTRAVVIGISDYREPLIPDLRFADKDAEAFADWLRSPKGLALPDSNIHLLTNQQATNAQIIVNLDWLIEASKPGDRAFIYFSGHGDVERVTKFNRGYLLGSDSPPAVYGAGAFSLDYLQDILSTLSENDVQVFIITDACRAGKLAGNSVSGTQVTATQLSQQFANEIKVLSCQPDEFSLEGEQWGGGRGCFSYHLEDALYGFADDNHDASVDLLELRRYLEDHVSREAAPDSQVPMVSGPVKTRITAVRESEVAARKAAKGNRPVPFLAIENKGMESRLLEKMDTSGQHLYAQFLAAIDSGNLMSPLGKSANDYFKRLIEKPEMAALHGSMKRKLAAALMEEGQTILNKVLQTDPVEVEKCHVNYGDYDHLPGYFNRAAEILGEGHYVYKSLKAKELYFHFLTTRKNFGSDSRDILYQALSFDSSLAIVYMALGYTYPNGNEAGRPFLQKGAELVPNWAVAHNDIGYTYYRIDPTTAIVHHKKAMNLDSNYLDPLVCLAWNFDDIGQFDSANIFRRLLIEKFERKNKFYPNSITATDCISVAQSLWGFREHEKAKEYLLLAEKISKGRHGGVYGNLMLVCTDLLEFENAARACNMMFDVNHGKKRDWAGWPGHIYFNFLYDNASAIQHYERTTTIERGQVEAWYLLDKSRAFAAAKKAMLDSVALDFCLLPYYAGESARHLGMPDTTIYYFKMVAERAKIKFIRNDFDTPDYLFAAVVRHRMGEMQAFQNMVDTIQVALPKDPWLHFHLACIYAQTGNEKAAIANLEKAFGFGWLPNPLAWMFGTLCDPLLNPIRESEGYKALVREHFPKYYDIATRIPGKH